MCLNYSRNLKQEDEIKCYKVFLMDKNGTLISPFYKDTKWEIGEVKVAEFDDASVGKKLVDSSGCVRGGVFHTLESETDAWEYYNHYMDFYYTPTDLNNGEVVTVVAECTIPKDNGYLFKGYVVYGHYASFLNGYASEKLRVDKVVLKK